MGGPDQAAKKLPTLLHFFEFWKVGQNHPRTIQTVENTALEFHGLCGRWLPRAFLAARARLPRPTHRKASCRWDHRKPAWLSVYTVSLWTNKARYFKATLLSPVEVKDVTRNWSSGERDALQGRWFAHGVDAYFSPSWTSFHAERGCDFSVIVDGISN